MPRDIEEQLRRSLQTRAHDITPDPATFSRVQAKVRRTRTLRIALAGVGAALAVAAVAVAGPRMLDRRIEFETPPVATQPAPESTPTAAPPRTGQATHDIVFTDGVAVYATTVGRATTAPIMRSDYAPTCPSEAGCQPIVQVLADGGAGVATSTVLTVEGCGGLRYGRYAGADAAVGDTTFAADSCPTSAAFSPDGASLAWVSETPDGWGLSTVGWSSSGPDDNDQSWTLPWTDATDVELLDWVWTAETDTTAEGYVVVRARRGDVPQVTQFPIERQADGGLALSLEAGSVPWSPGFTPWAFAAAGDTTYTLEVELTPDGPANARIVRRVVGNVDGELGLPPELFNNTEPPFDEADLWMAAADDAVVYGNEGQGRAWYVDWRRSQPQLVDVDATADVPVVSMDLVVGGDPPPPADEQSQIQVDVYFGMEGADACVASEPVAREVEGPGVARAALTELLAGPTSTESNEGIVSPFSANTAGALNDVTIVEGEARVDFADFSGDVGDDSCTKSAIIDALNSTLLQFPTVTSTRYSFDGSVEAWESWLGAGGESPGLPPTLPDAVAATAADIHAAAQARDYEALEALMRDGFACSFSDQPEPCVPIWKEQERNGGDPLGTLVEILEMEPIRNPDAPIWVWPAEWIDGDYLGPRTGINEDGLWMYYQQGGD